MQRLLLQHRVLSAMSVLGVFFFASVVYAATATSTNYQLASQTIGSGGGTSTSTNYSIEGTVGPLFTGTRSSENFGTASVTGSGSVRDSTGGDQSTEEQITPVVSSLSIAYEDGGVPLSSSEGVSLNVGTTTIHIYGTAVDLNGTSTISGVSASLYRSNLIDGATCTSDRIDCYQDAVCSLIPVTETAMHYDCMVELSSGTTSTDTGSAYENAIWRALVTVSDVTNATSTRTFDIEMNSLLALDFASEITFGTLTLGATTSTSTNREMIFTQEGNTPVDIEMYSNADFTCSLAGSIPRENLSWSRVNVGYTHASSTALTASPTVVPLDLLAPTTVSSHATSSLFWNIYIPEEGVLGTCGGSVIIQLISGA